MYEARIIRKENTPWFYNPVAKGRTIEDIKEEFDKSEVFLITKYKDDGHFYGIYLEEGVCDEGDRHFEDYCYQYPIEGVIKEIV